MSAFLAIFARNGEAIEATTIMHMLSATSECNQHGEGIWHGQNVALAHQSFWLTPEEVGEHQPLQREGLVLVSDARLDNRAEIIANLGLEPAYARKMSDHALILEAYRKWGVDCPHYLLGDFAFVLWDVQRQHLFAARDALGSHSLCYFVNHDLCLMASYIPTLLKHPQVRSVLNEAKIADFLAGLWHGHAETLYQDIFFCPPAHCLQVTAESVRLWRYWDFEPSKRIRYKDDEEYAEHFLDLLQKVVCSRLHAVGPLGIAMSGGLDSTSITALCATQISRSQMQTKKIHIFSYTFENLKECDESASIRDFLQMYRDIEAHLFIGDDQWTLRGYPDWPVLPDFILTDPFPGLTRMVMEGAQQAGCQVLFTGAYGDALFWGSKFWMADMLRDMRLGSLLSEWREHRPQINWKRDFWGYGLRQQLPNALRYSYRRLKPIPIERLHPGLNPEFVQRTNLAERVLSDTTWRRYTAPGKWKRFRDLTDGYHYQGHAAMRRVYHQHGLEIIQPYYDRRLVEFALALPADQLGRPYCSKWILRNAMRNLLPEAILSRQNKPTYYTLFARGLLEKERATAQALLLHPKIVQMGFVRQDWIQKELVAGHDWSNNGYYLWQSLALEIWLQKIERN